MAAEFDDEINITVQRTSTQLPQDSKPTVGLLGC